MSIQAKLVGGTGAKRLVKLFEQYLNLKSVVNLQRASAKFWEIILVKLIMIYRRWIRNDLSYWKNVTGTILTSWVPKRLLFTFEVTRSKRIWDDICSIWVFCDRVLDNKSIQWKNWTLVDLAGEKNSDVKFLAKLRRNGVF